MTGLYLHVPFCRRICPYCDFAVRTGTDERRARFARDLRRELELWRERWPETIATLYLGGGTPSQLTPAQLGDILDSARRALDIDADARVTLEANPEDLDPAIAQAWRDLGIDTLSLGAQSMDGARLRWLGRAHTPDDIRRAVHAARDAGVRTVSVDLIYGLPDETPQQRDAELRAIASLGADHLSAYQLTVADGTPFGRARASGSLYELAEPAQADAFRQVHETLGEAGYTAYEVSNFARAPEHRSRHNQAYWTGAAYLAVGPGAHGFDGQARRWWNHARLPDWERAVDAGRHPIAGEETLTPTQRRLEQLMLGLRTAQGVALDEGLGDANRALIEELVEQSLATVDGNWLRPTLSGWAVADGLAARFELPRPDAPALHPSDQ